ncbi:MAG TPA: amidohydrolase family protein [Stellaceae bacterium]|nr:amidohydrolase family protein [Stellaceae bacterium]
MTTRRGFLKGAAAGGLVFCTCGLQDAARAAAGAAGGNAAGATGSTNLAPRHHLPVMVKGKRIRTIDMHSHCYFHDAIKLMGDDAKHVLPPVKGVDEMFIPADDHTEVQRRLTAMDNMGIDMEVLSINPYWYGKDRETAGAICKIHNQHFAELRAAYPKRFSAFASLSLQYPDLAAQELETAMKSQGLAGAAIGSTVNGTAFSDPQFHPVWAKAEELGATLFIHPQTQPEMAKRYKGNGWLSNTIGNPLDTTIALEHLIFQGTLDKFPKLKILAAHGGGYVDSYSARMDYPCGVSPQNCDPTIKLKKEPSAYIRDIHVDAMVFTPEALKYLISQVGIDKIVLGTDYPIPWELHPIDRVYATKLTDAERIAIFRDNAQKLMGIKL